MFANSGKAHERIADAQECRNADASRSSCLTGHATSRHEVPLRSLCTRQATSPAECLSAIFYHVSAGIESTKLALRSVAAKSLPGSRISTLEVEDLETIGVATCNPSSMHESFHAGREPYVHKCVAACPINHLPTPSLRTRICCAASPYTVKTCRMRSYLYRPFVGLD